MDDEKFLGLVVGGVLAVLAGLGAWVGRGRRNGRAAASVEPTDAPPSRRELVPASDPMDAARDERIAELQRDQREQRKQLTLLQREVGQIQGRLSRRGTYTTPPKPLRS